MNRNTSDMIYWLWFSLALGPGCRNSSEILDTTACNVKKIYAADEKQYIEWGCFKKHQIEKLLNKDLSEAERIFDYCGDNCITLLNPRSENYPRILARIPSCPIVLYVLGTLPNFEHKISVALVGTRNMSQTGKRTAYEISYDLAKSGIIVTSGMALGIDGVCHTAALDCGGLTIAVLGCGIDVVYPSQHRELMENIITFNGAVISEFAPGTKPYPGNFPIRNRIISGLSVGTVVVEAGEKSGALNTARHALEQGRDIFAVPGPAGEYSSMGSNNLLKEGAVAITCGSDIVGKYIQRYANKISFYHIIRLKEAENYKPITKSTKNPLSLGNYTKTTKEGAQSSSENIVNEIREQDTPMENKDNDQNSVDVAKNEELEKKKTEFFNSSDSINKRIYDSIEKESKFPDQISLELNVPISNVLTCITIMEIQGLIIRQPGGQYIAK